MVSSSSSCDSSSSGHHLRLGPPIPYREHPIEYEPPTPRWSDENPGRRYHKCRFSKIGGTGGCEYYYWVDDPTTPFAKGLIVDLPNVVWDNR
ncbi:hypothetical protein ZWY2020_032445 [Hordeum vulgare]|nr:hypothetical protein ZWY2020_032445 [Hordeum vulgare]